MKQQQQQQQQQISQFTFPSAATPSSQNTSQNPAMSEMMIAAAAAAAAAANPNMAMEQYLESLKMKQFEGIVAGGGAAQPINQKQSASSAQQITKSSAINQKHSKKRKSLSMEPFIYGAYRNIKSFQNEDAYMHLP